MFRWLVILLLFCPTPAQAEITAGTPSLEAFASLPLIESMQLSPSGRHLALLRHQEGRSILLTQIVPGSEPRVVVTAEDRESRIAWFSWVNDERLLVGLRMSDTRGGVETAETRLLAVNRDGTQQISNLLKHAPFPSLMGNRLSPQFQDQVVGILPNEPNHALVALDVEHPASPDVYDVDLASGKRALVQANPGPTPEGHNVLQWLADREGHIRVGIGQVQSTVRIIVRPPGSETWKDFAEYDAAKETGPLPLGFGADPAWLYVRDLHRGRASVFKVNLVDPSAERILVATDPKSDLLGELVYAHWSKNVIGIRWGTADRRVLFWDFDAQRLQARIDRALVGRTNVIESSSHDGRLHIVKSGGTAHPPVFHIFDERDGTMTKLGEAYPQLTTLQAVEPDGVRVIARDGKELLATITMSKQQEQRRAPLIVFPHGEFGSRDSTGFNPWTQWFASRGWAVLQVNFRNVLGFGNDFLLAGFQRWGLELSDDLTDSVRWAIQQDIADPSRVCVVGANYGGYAALMATVRNPELYRCAVSFGAVTDLLQLTSDNRWYLNRKDVSDARIASWWGDRERVRETSPTAHAKELRTPLLLLHGAMDRLVPVSHARGLVDALTAAHIASFRYLELPRADQALTGGEDRLQVFQELDRFLHHHLE